jgi:hypothetical protein
VYSTDCENGCYITVLVNYPWPSISIPTSEFSLCLSSSGGPSPSLEPAVTDAASTSLNPPAVRYHSDHDSDVIPVGVSATPDVALTKNREDIDILLGIKNLEYQ